MIRVEFTRTVPPDTRRVYALWLGLAATRIVRGVRRYVYARRTMVGITLDGHFFLTYKYVESGSEELST